jgi:hypothetical protein
LSFKRVMQYSQQYSSLLYGRQFINNSLSLYIYLYIYKCGSIIEKNVSIMIQYRYNILLNRREITV